MHVKYFTLLSTARNQIRDAFNSVLVTSFDLANNGNNTSLRINN